MMTFVAKETRVQYKSHIIVLFIGLSLFVEDIYGAVRCATTRPSGVGFVYNEDVQLSVLAANSPDALPGRPRPSTTVLPPIYGDRRPTEYFQRPPRRYDPNAEYLRRNRPVLGNLKEEDDWPVRRNGTGGNYPADRDRDRISKRDRYPGRRNDSSYGTEDDSWNQIPDEPSESRYGRRPYSQRRNESRPYEDADEEYGRQQAEPLSPEDEEEEEEDSRLIQLLVKRERDRARRVNGTYSGGRSTGYLERPTVSQAEDSYQERPSRRPYPPPPERYSYRDEEGDSCPIETRETQSQQTDFPLTAASAVLSVPIGDFILYATEAPGKAIISYNLNCDGPDARGKDPLYTASANSCFHLQVVEDLVNKQVPIPIVICLSHGAFSTAFRVDYDQNQFRLQPCLQIIEHKHLTDVATVSAGKHGALVAFSNNDLRPEAEYHETIAPIYIARAGQLLLCGYVDLQHTTDVALWHVRKNEFVAAYIERRPGSRRSLIHLFEIVLKNGRCHSIRPKRDQSMIGGAHYKGQSNTLCASEPFTIDHAICGAEDIQFLTSHDKVYHSSTHLAIAIANDAFEEGRVGCPHEELVCPDNTRQKCFCACPHANHRSLVIEFDSNSGIFDFSHHQLNTFQELMAGPESVTEILHLPTERCCMVFQTISPLGSTELYTIERDDRSNMRVFQFFDSGLPHFAEKSSFGYCSANDLIISYTLHSFQTDNTIYHLQCNKDRRQPYVDRYNPRPSDNYRDRDNGPYGGDRDYRTGANQYRGGPNNYTLSNSNDRDYDNRPYGNISNNYPVAGRGNNGYNGYNNRTSQSNAFRNYNRYRPYNQPGAPGTGGRPRISAVFPDVDYGNVSYGELLRPYPQVPLNRTAQQQYRPAAQAPAYYGPPQQPQAPPPPPSYSAYPPPPAPAPPVAEPQQQQQQQQQSYNPPPSYNNPQPGHYNPGGPPQPPAPIPGWPMSYNYARQ
ncbi:hypothetical protein BV898_01318 [Hypsibius exemplaris]|uniref:Uncharacterized protein n=1 Tax=Hypsibius exemplaris TaxID=2072580 RepID=A0A1W0XB27_HYPEX|nr:hypothetical protein BV898_01318 [Hypsibius exemplaris]